MSPKALRGSIRWAIRNAARAHRAHSDALIAYVNARTARDARVLLARVTAAEIVMVAARAQLRRLQDARRVTWAETSGTEDRAAA